MTVNPLFCYEDQEIKEVSRLMEQNGIRRLLVLDRNGLLVGLVSLSDVARKGHDERIAGRVLGRVSDAVCANVF
jgi:predicted transcriptional regulator